MVYSYKLGENGVRKDAHFMTLLSGISKKHCEIQNIKGVILIETGLSDAM